MGKNTSDRYFNIDFLRAISIIGVIAVHVFYFNLTNNVNRFIWNYLNFVVVAFVYCSSFVLVAKVPTLTFKNLMQWYKKRLARLLVPFYYYFFLHLILVILFPNLFDWFGADITKKFILQSIFLIGGENLSWLTLLFIQLTIVFPFIEFFMNSKRNSFLLFITTLIVSVVMTIWIIPYNYFRYVMWIPYVLIQIISIYIFRYSQKNSAEKNYLYIFISSTVIWIVLQFIWPLLHRPFYFIDNKYPPNLYYLSYAIGITFLVLFVTKYLVFNSMVKKWITFISKSSYLLFFIHYVVLDFFENAKKLLHFSLSAFFEFGIILVVSVGVSYLFSMIKTRNSKQLRI